MRARPQQNQARGLAVLASLLAMLAAAPGLAQEFGPYDDFAPYDPPPRVEVDDFEVGEPPPFLGYEDPQSPEVDLPEYREERFTPYEDLQQPRVDLPEYRGRPFYEFRPMDPMQ